MPGLSDTIARLTAAAVHEAVPLKGGSSRLGELGAFGANPGALKGFLHVPENLLAHAPLVVVLHGCTQSAAGYDRASGWSRLADEHGFALLYPEQQRSNNANGCFNWFEPLDTRRDSGEALSIRQMIAAVHDQYALDRDRTFITGLSAGGAMTASMLATYPDVFAGGAIIAGLPHGAAVGMVEAFDRMRGHRPSRDGDLQAALRTASRHAGPWPRLSIWHGDADATVNVSNAAGILAQWRAVHDIPDQPTIVDRIDNVPHRAWHGPDGRVLVEEYIVPGMAHGVALKTSGAGACGSVAPFMLDVGISSTRRIAQFWGIAALDDRAYAEPVGAAVVSPPPPVRRPDERLYDRRVDQRPLQGTPSVGQVIEDALRAAGLMK